MDKKIGQTFAPKEIFKQEYLVPEVVLPKEEIIFDSIEEYKEKFRNQYILDPYEHSTTVPQGHFVLYEGKPLYSGGFTSCVGIILESARTIGFLHLDPGGQWKHHIKKIKKYFEGESTKIILAKGNDAWRPDDIYACLKELKVPIIESKVIEVPSGKDRWELVYDPVEGNVTVHSAIRSADQEKASIYNIGKSKYSAQEHQKAKDFFESRDYMPPGYREAEKFFAQRNSKIEEAMLDTWGVDPEKTLAEVLHFKEHDKLIVWTPKDGFVEKEAVGSDIIAEMMTHDWDPGHTLLFVETPYPEDSKVEHKAFVWGYVPNPTLSSLWHGDFDNKEKEY